MLASLRAAPVPESLDAYASSLSGFPERAIDKACIAVERSAPAQFGSKFPSLGEMLEACRKAELGIRYPKDVEWTVERYREAFELNQYVDEEIASGKDRSAVLDPIRANHPGLFAMWVAWRNQAEAGTIQVPERWCVVCRGRAVLVDRLPSGALQVRDCQCRAAA